MKKITSMVVENFLSFGNAEFCFDEQGLVLVEGDNRDDESASSNGCLSGDTLIDCARDLKKYPKGIPMKELVGTRPWVYAWCENRIVLRKAERVWRTKKKAKVVRVILRKEDGHVGTYTAPMELIGTFDHQVLLSDGMTWKALGSLTSDDRLCSMYRRESGGWRTLLHWTGCGHMKMGSLRGARTYSEQQFVCTEVHGPKPDDRYEVHHINGNPYDHQPDNLVWVENGAHKSEHTSERNRLGLAGWMVSGRHPRGMAGKNHTPEIRAQISETLKRKAAERRSRGLNGNGKPNHVVVSVEDAGWEDVYDMRVPGADSFVANGVVVHNSGKSAMIDALVWCLFGTTLRGYDGDEVVHRKAKVGEGCVVHVRFLDGDDGWVVTRARRHPTIKNALVLMTQDGDDRSKPSARETQEEIERVLGCTRRTFLSSVVFGQDRAYRFSALTDGEQKQVLDEVLGVERFAQACVAARARVTSVRSDLDGNRRALDKIEESRDAAEADAADLEAKGDNFAVERARKLEAERDKLSKADEWIGKARRFRDVDRLKEACVEAAAQQEVVEGGASAARDVLGEARERYAAANAKVDDLAARLRKHRALGGDCPTCGQAIDDDELLRVVADLERQLAAAKRAADKVASQVDAAKDALEVEDAKVTASRASARAAQKVLNESVGAAADMEAWRRRAVDCQARIAEIEEEENPYAALAAKARSRHTQLAADADQLSDHISADEARLRVAQFWVEAFGTKGLRSLLVDSSLPLLNQEAARVSRAITGGTISVEFSATSELKSGKSVDRFEVRVDNRHGAGSYRGNSAGERAKVDLCVGLALQRLVASRSSASFNVVFFDEAFDHLDSAAHERVVEVLAELDRDSVFVVSHNEDLRAFFPNVITIKKQGGFSSVE